MESPTVIVFAREPLKGLAKTRLARRVGAEAAARLAAAFTLDTIAKARALNPRALVIAGTAPGGALASRYFRRLARRFDAALVDQGRGGLGARMAGAMAPYAERGVVLVGTDCPSLPACLLARGVAMLKRSAVVLGPSLDGGYYLIGVKGVLPPIFSAIRWGRGDVLTSTIARLSRARRECLLAPAWYDVDRWPDLAMLTMHLRMLTGAQEKLPGGHPCPATARALIRLGLLDRRR